MSGILVAEFSDPMRFTVAAQRAHTAHYRVVDAFTPYPVESVFDLLEHRPSHIRVVMFIGGVGMAALAYGLEYYSAAVDYPYNSGGRPLDAWPAFMLVPFATGILVAAIFGFVRFLTETGLPRLHHRLFTLDGFERASQDRFLLALERPDAEEDQQRAVDFLRGLGAALVREVAP